MGVTWFFLLSAPSLVMVAAADDDPTVSAEQVTLNAADRLRLTGAYVEATVAYAALLDRPADRLDAACGLALCYLETGRYEDAEATLRSVADLGGQSSRWWRASAAISQAVGKYAEAAESLTRALDISPDDLPSRYMLGRVHERLGVRDAAVKTYARFDELLAAKLPEDAADLTSLGQGALRYSVLTRHPNLTDRTQFVLTDLFQRAYEQIDRTYWPARLAAAELLRSKFKNDEAAADYQAALRINPQLAEAHAGMGWLPLDQWDFEGTEKCIAAAKRTNPRSTEAFKLEAALHLTDRKYDDALRAANEALAINPNDVDALGYAAAASYAQGNPAAVNEMQTRAARASAAPSGFHRIMGDSLGALRQYEESEIQYQQAIRLDPTDPHPRTELGMMYMQWGEEAKAHETLTAAWELDPFDARTLNTLKLLETIQSYPTHRTEHFVIRCGSPRDAVLVPYMADRLEDIHADLAEDYNWTPTDQTTIEVFPTHRMFGVRITGKPWIHTVGACTGKVIAMESPRQDPELHGRYNYARVLRHEYTHTVTLAVTANRIPHWFTEGLAVLQEDAPRSFEWCESLAQAARRGELFTLETIDWGFMRPRRARDRQLAYAQAEWMCEFIIDRFGYGTINRMLDGYRQRKAQPAVLKDVLALTPDEFDRRFADWARESAAPWGFDLTPPQDAERLRTASQGSNDATLWASLARAELDAGNVEQAVDAAQKSIELDDNNVQALTVLGEILWTLREQSSDPTQRDGVSAALVNLMSRLLDQDPRGWIAPKSLSAIAMDNGDFDKAVEWLTRLKRVLPCDPAADKGLAGIFLSRGNYDDALPHLLDLARTSEDDPDIALTAAMIYHEQKRPTDARYWLMQAMDIDPFNVQTHETLAAVCESLNDARAAFREYESLCILLPNDVKRFEQAAQAAQKLGDESAAKRYAQRAVALDPATRVRSIIDAAPP